MKIDKIHIKRMLFYGYHGVFPEETRLGQRFNVDLVVSLDLKQAGQTDELSYTVNYAELYNTCREIVEGKPFKLVEALADKLASTILLRFPLIQSTTITVVKPDPPIPGHYESVAVEITRSR